jgi:hypothetical protein
LLQETRKKYSVRSPEKQLPIDIRKRYKRVIPLDCFDLGSEKLERVVLVGDIEEEGIS